MLQVLLEKNGHKELGRGRGFREVAAAMVVKMAEFLFINSIK